MKDIQAKLNRKGDELFERAEQFVKEVGLKLEVQKLIDECSDPAVEFGTSGIGVSIVELECDGRYEYQAYASTYDPGVMYHSDGSGTPPSWDVHELGKHSEYPDRPLITALQAWVENTINDLLEHETEEELVKELQPV